MNEEIEKINDSIELAIMEINLIRQEIAVMGANDSEFDDLNTIVKKLKNGEFKSPQDAIAKAIEIRERKNSYH